MKIPELGCWVDVYGAKGSPHTCHGNSSAFAMCTTFVVRMPGEEVVVCRVQKSVVWCFCLFVFPCL